MIFSLQGNPLQVVPAGRIVDGEREGAAKDGFCRGDIRGMGRSPKLCR